jgi:outer membrane lipoprotein-sorting protein
VLALLTAAAVLAVGQPSLTDLMARLATAPAWRADFEQHYVPAGFDEGTTDHGRVVVAPPGRLRFDYAGAGARIFAVDGSIARMVDAKADTCDAIALDRQTVAGLPLAVLLDPVRARDAFSATVEGNALVLMPHSPSPDVAQIRIVVGGDGLPEAFTIVDDVGNRNEFVFIAWRGAKEAPAEASFQPSLPGHPPCTPRPVP